MLFTTWTFWSFFVAVLVLFYAVPVGLRRYLLLIASLVFYAAWDPRFIPLLLILITVDYFAAIWISQSEGARRRTALIISLMANLGFLGWFKYTNFVITTWTQLIHSGTDPKLLDLIIPLGISFHTFQSISYVVDVYTRKQAVVRSYVDFALYVAFFPQLVAGPIVRALDFFKDHWNWQPPSADDIRSGCMLIAVGLAKKLVCADRFALISDHYFADPTAIPGLLPAWTGTFAFAMQIFFDFSGYTDIAIGTARLLGYHFPDNFQRPYLSAGITEFWRRWHISLSSWLRDYLYIPFGGNRYGEWKTYRNLMLTMLIGGFWHGASWNFVIWGGYHGALLSIERMLFGKKNHEGLIRIPLAVITVALVCIGWVFFRATTFDAAVYVIGQMFTGEMGESLIGIWQWRLVAFTLFFALLREYGVPRFPVLRASWVRGAVIVVLLLGIELLGVTDQKIPFVYFQF